jgi:heme/copper-type cytochrome/quinol oxidase subunit 3
MHGSKIPIWFFIGVLLLAYGILITAYGIYEVVTGQLANVALNQLHAPLWWGATLLLLGVFYTVNFRPGKSK